LFILIVDINHKVEDIMMETHFTKIEGDSMKMMHLDAKS